MYSVIARHMSSYPIKERERKDALEAFRDALLLHEPFYFLQLTKQGVVWETMSCFRDERGAGKDSPPKV